MKKSEYCDITQQLQDPFLLSQLEDIRIAQYNAYRDINEHGEFDNPYCPLNQPMLYRAYDVVESYHEPFFIPATQELN